MCHYLGGGLHGRQKRVKAQSESSKSVVNSVLISREIPVFPGFLEIIRVVIIKYKCFSGKAPYIESTEVFDVIRFSLKTAQEQARYIGRLLESDKDEVKRCQNIVLRPYREQARTLMDALAEKDVERTAVYRKYERCEIEQEQLENFESRYQAEIEELEAEFKNIMMKVSAIEKAFSYANPWLIKFQDLTLPEVLELAHIRKYVERVWIEDFKRVEVVLKEEEWTRFFPEEWLRTRKEN